MRAISRILTVAVVLAAVASLSWAGPGCHGEKAGEAGAHCMLWKNVAKKATMTQDGAVVTLTGSGEDAVKHIQSHLQMHQNGQGGCEGCPTAAQGVTAKFEVTGDGGVITLTAANPEALKVVQEWAAKPAGGCCAKSGAEKKV
jgi:hypothetical protein